MKFVCDACGKKYATSEDPSPGKVYKLRCKACGHLIVVKSQAGTSTAIPAITAAELAAGGVTPGINAQAPELEIDIEPDHQQAPTPAPAPTPVDDEAVIEEPAPLPPEVASAVDGAVPIPSPPPPGQDELADFAAAAAEAMAAAPEPAGAGPRQGYVDLFGEGSTGERPASGDKFAEAARASLPEGFAGADPLAAPRAAPPPPKAAPPRAAAPMAPRPGKGPSPLVFVGLGAVLIGAITFAAISSSGKKPEPTAPPAAAASPAPAPPARPPVEAPPAVEPPRPAVEEKRPEPKPEPKTAPRSEPQRTEPQRARPPERRPEPKPEPRPPERRPEPKPEPKPEPRAAEPVEARTETRDVRLADAQATLTPEVIQRVINADRKAFASCITAAGTDVKLDGRKVVLTLTVNAGGAVTYPTLDDVTLNATEMGQCLKSAARLMIFPKFRGDPFHVEVPLTLSN